MKNYSEYIKEYEAMISAGQMYPYVVLNESEMLEIFELGKQIFNGDVPLNEGFDIDAKTKTVSFNPNHQENINTGNLYDPKPIFDKFNKWDLISIFKRERNEYSNDGNPVIYALKNEFGWKFKNKNHDLYALLRRFVYIAHQLYNMDTTYDTIVIVPSKNKLNAEIMIRLAKILRCKTVRENFFNKLDKWTVIEDQVDEEMAENDGMDLQVLRTVLYNSIKKMPTKSFQFHFIPVKYRKYIKHTFESYNMFEEIEYKDDFNDKNVIVLDDTIATGRSVSEACEIIEELYDVKKLTIITLFSKLK